MKEVKDEVEGEAAGMNEERVNDDSITSPAYPHCGSRPTRLRCQV